MQCWSEFHWNSKISAIIVQQKEGMNNEINERKTRTWDLWDLFWIFMAKRWRNNAIKSDFITHITKRKILLILSSLPKALCWHNKKPKIDLVQIKISFKQLSKDSNPLNYRLSIFHCSHMPHTHLIFEVFSLYKEN